MVDIVEDIIFWNFLATKCTAAYVHNIEGDYMLIKHKLVFLLLISLGKDVLAETLLSVTQLDDHTLHISSVKHIFLMIQVADELFENDQKTTPSHASFFYRHTRVPIAELHASYLEQGEDQF